MDKFKKNTRTFFDKIAEGIRLEKRKPEDEASKLELAKVDNFLSLPQKSSIIELGCGIGRFVMYLLKRGYQVTGVDISRKSLNFLNQRSQKEGLNKNLKLVLNDFQKPVFEKKFNAGLCISTFHLLASKEEERIKILLNLYKSLKPDGMLLIIEPNPLNIFFYPFYFFHPKTQWNIEKHFLKSNEKNLRRIFRRLGLKDIKVDYFGFLPNRLINVFPFVNKINYNLNKMPLVKKFSAFIFIRGVKQ